MTFDRTTDGTSGTRRQTVKLIHDSRRFLRPNISTRSVRPSCKSESGNKNFKNFQKRVEELTTERFPDAHRINGLKEELETEWSVFSSNWMPALFVQHVLIACNVASTYCNL